MKFTTLLVSALCVLSASAQRSFIANPAAGTVIHAGQTLTVQVTRPNSLQGSREVGFVIGLQTCSSQACAPPAQQLGFILFNGDYNPQLHEIPGTPYQNFTVQVPAGIPNGQAQFATARLHLIGAGPSPTLELNSVSVSVA